MGKGSVPRPFDIPRDEYAANFDRIFGKKDAKKDKQPPQDKKDAK